MRARYLDYLRGMAVVWMVIFHTCYDMRTLQYIDWDFSSGFWYAFPRLIAGTFLFCVGISLNYTHRQGINLKALRERTIKLGAAALLISLATLIAFPTQWIYFGTLHCILAASLLGALFVHHRNWALGVMTLIIVLQYTAGFDIKWLSLLIQKPSMDFIPIYPWFWVVLAGLLIGPYLDKTAALQRLPNISFLRFLGQHSLKIYLLHQPLIFGLLWLCGTFAKP